jgi:hypothetical protein
LPTNVALRSQWDKFGKDGLLLKGEAPSKSMDDGFDGWDVYGL